MPRRGPGPRARRAARDRLPHSQFPPCMLHCVTLAPFRLLLGFHQLDTPPAHAIGERLEQLLAVLPADAAIGDALPVDERLTRHEILPPGFQVTLDHDAENAVLAGGELARDIGADLDLLLRILARVRMAEIDHQALGETGF